MEAFIYLTVFVNVLAFNKEKSILTDAITSIISEKPWGTEPTVFLSFDSKVKTSTMDQINEIISKSSSDTIFQIDNFNHLSAFKRFVNVILVENLSSFENFYGNMTQNQFDFQGTYLIVLTGINERLPNDELKAIFNLLWKKFIVNVNILLLQTESKASLFTFFPYTKHYCAEVHPVLWNTFDNGQFRVRSNFYPEKINNLFGCSLNIASFDAPTMVIKKLLNDEYSFKGVDGNLLEILANRMNFKVNFTYLNISSIRWGVLYTNGSSSGAIRHVSIIKFKFSFETKLFLTVNGWPS